jgi:hypothetical protein
MAKFDAGTLNKAKQEAGLIANVVKARLDQRQSRVIMGWDALEEMFQVGSRDYVNYGHRQIEWMAFYFEFLCLSRQVQKQQGWSMGPSFGARATQRFDLMKDFVWDLKCHDEEAGKRLILNDYRALDQVFPSQTLKEPRAVAKPQGVGFIILCGRVVRDEDEEFRAFRAAFRQEPLWEGERVRRPYSSPKKKSSRMLKLSFEPTSIKVFYLHERPPAEEAKLKSGVLTREKQPHNAVLMSGKEPDRDDKYHLKLDVAEERGWLLEMKL